MTDEDKLRGLREHNEKLNKVILESLQQALLILMERKEFKSITISELCEKAGVSRMSFYANYKTKDNLVEAIVMELNKDLLKKVGSPFRDYVSIEWYITLFETTKFYSKTLILMFQAGFKYRYISIINNLVLHDKSISERQRYSRLMWSGGIINIIIDWLEHDMVVPVSEIAEYCFNSFTYLE